MRIKLYAKKILFRCLSWLWRSPVFFPKKPSDLRATRSWTIRLELAPSDARINAFFDSTDLVPISSIQNGFCAYNFSPYRVDGDDLHALGKLCNWRLYDHELELNAVRSALIGHRAKPESTRIQAAQATAFQRMDGPAGYHSVEDFRIFRSGDRLLGIGCHRMPGSLNLRALLAVLSERDGTLKVESCHSLDETASGNLLAFDRDEKNWTPLPINSDEVAFVQNAKTGRSLHFDLRTRKLTLLDPGTENRHSETPELAKVLPALRLPSSPFSVSLEKRTYFMTLGHIKSMWFKDRLKNQVYEARLVILESLFPFRIAHVSTPLRLGSLGEKNFIYPFQMSEHPSDPDNVLISLNVDDSFQKILAINKNSLLELAKFIPSSGVKDAAR